MNNTDTKVFKDLVVVDLGVGMAAALVTKMLAEYGAKVIRVDPLGGDPFARRYPGYAVWHRRAEKDELAGHSAERLEVLIAGADICVLGGEEHPDIAARVNAQDLAKRHPELVILNIQAYPSGAPDSGGAGVDVLVQARSGLVFEQFSDRPILMAFEPCDYGAALQGLLGVCAALYERTSSGRGQVVETSLFEGALTWLGMFWAHVEKQSKATDFVLPLDPYPTIFRCSDGQFIHFVTGSAGSKYLTFQALGIDDPSIKPDDPGLPDMSHPKKFFGPVDLYAQHCARLSSREVLERMWARGLPVAPVLSPGGCWDEPQIQLNGIIVRDGNGTRYVGCPIRIDASGGVSGSPATTTGNRPLEGLRILDFGAFVAGPLASAILTDLGADVVKVEPIGGDPCRRAAFRSFSAANRGKQSVALDLKNPDGLAIARTLLAKTDAVTSNFRPGASTRLGIDPRSLHDIRADMVVLESPAFGSQGPLVDRAGFDMVMQALCGHEVSAAGAGNPPMWNRTGMIDTAAGMLGAIGVLAGLYHRARTGQGVSLESSLVNAGIFMLSQLIQGADGKFTGVEPLDPERTGHRPSEALYRTQEGWIALAARGEKAGKRLAAALGLEDTLDGEPETWGAEEGEAIARRIAGKSTREALACLQAADVAAEECRRNVEAHVMLDPGYQAIGTVRSSVHPQFGEVRELGSLVRFSRSITGNARSAPLLGQNTRELLVQMGADDSQISDWYTRRIIA